MNTQTMRVLEHLEKCGSITTLEATTAYGITRLSARIWELRHIYGERIRAEKVRVKTRYGTTTVNRYSLETEATA